VREGYFDGLAVIRSQDNFVVQWGDAEGKRPLKSARSSVPPEFTVAKGMVLPFTRLPDADGYAPEVGFSGAFPAARDPRTGIACRLRGLIVSRRMNHYRASIVVEQRRRSFSK